jgi:hypothetical protein
VCEACLLISGQLWGELHGGHCSSTSSALRVLAKDGVEAMAL